MLLDIAALAAGVLLLAKAPDLFVVGAGRISLALRVSPVVVGAVVMGFGTSAPELLVSAFAAAGGADDIAVGNIVGSNVANFSLVVGVAAIVAAPLAVSSTTLRREAPISFGAVVLFAIVLQGGLSPAEGALLLVALAGALTWIVVGGRVGDDPAGSEARSRCAPEDARGIAFEAGRTAVGLLGVLLAARLIVGGAKGVAAEAGLSEAFVGVVIVGIGTALPEIATAVQAARQGEADLIVGNLFGSNIFNSLAIGGVVALVGTGDVAQSLETVGAVAIVGTALAGWVLLGTGHRLTRVEAGLLIAAYAALLPFL